MSEVTSLNYSVHRNGLLGHFPIPKHGLNMEEYYAVNYVEFFARALFHSFIHFILSQKYT